jgi:Ser/Thr protein kinase RdoA (MazF antagonist)
VHGYWWENLYLGEAIGPRFPDASAAKAYAANEARNYERFADFMGDAFSPARRQIYETVLASSYLFEKRIPGERPLTLNHGDAHLWNYLYPHDKENGSILMIDWDDCRIDIGMADLAYMIALHWYPERRARFEKHLIQRYHTQLLAHGVTGYTWEDCWNDYRLAAVEGLMIPIQQWAEGVPENVWWNHFERGLLAFEDLGCRELLHE